MPEKLFGQRMESGRLSGEPVQMHRLVSALAAHT